MSDEVPITEEEAQAAIARALDGTAPGAETREYFEIYTGRDGKFRWRLRAANHKTIASGQGYERREDAMHCIDLLRGLRPDTPVLRVFNELLDEILDTENVDLSPIADKLKAMVDEDLGPA